MHILEAYPNHYDNESALLCMSTVDSAHLLGGHAAAEEGRGCEVAAVAGVRGAHHVLGVPHLLGKLRDGQGAVLLAAAGSQGGEAHHEEVQAGEGDQVHCQLAQVSIQLACNSTSILQ